MKNTITRRELYNAIRITGGNGITLTDNEFNVLTSICNICFPPIKDEEHLTKALCLKRWQDFIGFDIGVIDQLASPFGQIWIHYNAALQIAFEEEKE